MTNGRFVSLDAARGVGAFGVVLWHWSHFFDYGVKPDGHAIFGAPFHSLFLLFYSYGWMGVDFFFTLSGFIFFHFYFTPIFHRRITAIEFLKRRLARLYPLYALTLLSVLALQAVYVKTHGSTFVYRPGSLLELLEAVTLTSHWWPNQEFLFNGPSWSISVECFLYAAFFLCARCLGRVRVQTFLGLAVVGVALGIVHWPIGRGLVSFFTGALIGILLRALTHSNRLQRAPRQVLFATLIVGAVLLLGMAVLLVPPERLGFPASGLPHLGEAPAAHFVVLMLFPYMVFLITLIETLRPMRSGVLRFLGDCSYSIYLLHFPLQLVTVLCLDQLGISRAILNQPAMFVAWCTLLFGLGALSYYGYEKPVQRRIRAIGLRRGATPLPGVTDAVT